ncbi:hypothetical protein O181_031726 [Austropuccinia psidii MF-1]|uniref:Tf2-1-like SH3-like domain-containing protein n=1 Tax=Austropuccinia psidii MF-1 TaxID=1389203 RepID=A0A9Q3H5G8_9BASI|nr:hypothetical protein [Austropuccinia psidii MF-1]
MSAIIKRIGTPGSLWMNFPTTPLITLQQTNHLCTVYGIDPQFDSAHNPQDTCVGKLSTKIQSVKQDLKKEPEVAINRLKRYSDKSRASSPIFNPGDMVWLSSKNIKSTRPAKKLSERWLVPLQILKKISTHAYHLKLSS